MKKIHYFAIASDIIALGLLLADFPKAAAGILGLTIMGAILLSALTGKQTNEGTK